MTPIISSPRARVGRSVGRDRQAWTTLAELFDAIPLDRVSTSMTIKLDRDHPARALCCRGPAPRGRAGRRTRGHGAGTTSSKSTSPGARYIYPPRASLRIVTDIFAFCERTLPNWKLHLDQRLSHPRDRARRPSRRSPSRLPMRTRVPWMRRPRACGARRQTASASGSRSVLSTPHNDFCEEDRENTGRRRGACGPGSCATASAPRNPRARSSSASTPRRRAARWTAQQPDNNNIVPRRDGRRWPPCSAARSRSTANGRDEAFGAADGGIGPDCPFARSKSSPPSRAWRTRWDPVAGAYFIEELTNRIEEEGGGPLLAPDRRCGRARSPRSRAGDDLQREIQESAYRAQLAIDAGRHRRRRA